MRRGVDRGSLQLPMGKAHGPAFFIQPAGHALRCSNGTVLSAGAAEGDRKIALAARLIALQQGFQQVEEPLLEGLIGGVGSQIISYRFVTIGLATRSL